MWKLQHAHVVRIINLMKDINHNKCRMKDTFGIIYMQILI